MEASILRDVDCLMINIKMFEIILPNIITSISVKMHQVPNVTNIEHIFLLLFFMHVLELVQHLSKIQSKFKGKKFDSGENNLTIAEFPLPKGMSKTLNRKFPSLISLYIF